MDNAGVIASQGASADSDVAEGDGLHAPVVLHARVVTGSGGGPDKTILKSPRFLTGLGYRCACAFLRPPHDKGFDRLRDRAAAWKAPIYEIDDRSPWDSDLVARSAKLANDLAIDIWHAHDYKTNLLGLLVNRRRPMTLVTTCHGWVQRTWRTLIYHQIDRLTLRHYDHVIAVSSDVATACRRMGVDGTRLSLIENAIDTDQFARSRSRREAKREIGWPDGRFLIGAVGRLSPEKGFDLLIRAIAQLVKNGCDIGLAIAGDGPEQANLQNLVSELGLADRVRLLGFQGDLIPLYEAMDVYALSSRREGLPNVLLEAMALEVPVVATKVAGVPTLIDNDKNGILVEAESVGALAEAIGQLVRDTALRSRFAAAGRETIVNRYSFAVRMAKVAAVYDQVLREPPGRRGRRG
jgi:glycosyltransferase involved in cell wall biosynthesis